jgi:hypothetical protein
MAMKETTGTRIGIVASIIGAIAAIIYLMRGNAPALVQAIQGAAGSPGTAGTPGPVGAAGAAGTAGPTGITGATGTAGAAGAPGPAGTPGSAGMASSNVIPGSDLGGFTPDLSILSSFFANQFFVPPVGPRPSVLTYNATGQADLGKQYMSVLSNPPSGSASSGCGCHGTGAGGGARKKPKCDPRCTCPNIQSAFRFHDGQGGCMSSSYGSLVEAMETCDPDVIETGKHNLASNLMYLGEAPPDLSQVNALIYQAGSRSAMIHDVSDATFPYTLLGTSY